MSKKVLFYFLVILILFVPLIKTYEVKCEYDEGIWENVYVFKELDLIILFMPLLILTFLIGFSKKKKILIYRILIVGTFLYSILGVTAILTPSMDSYPLIGAYLMVMLFPTVLFLMNPDGTSMRK
ncbi:conserved membrane hypothetical protein [Tenacibaculum maritimum]|uniref:hypothetical protein n=1 Tax=Tenacibaculum maritimum TaxID=107401 RepID=UPI0012E6C03D|nr:hypothetical protein [Tenacibaculum maritimum]CAA0183550.1 conserved membrane hypothetical protein [Tenacibaculum maritimum]